MSDARDARGNCISCGAVRETPKGRYPWIVEAVADGGMEFCSSTTATQIFTRAWQIG